MHVTVTDIYRYPVKSMGGHTLQATQLTEHGIPGDRCWTLKDEARGDIKGGKRFPQIMGMSARLRTEPSSEQPCPAADITLADGRVVHTDDADINAELSAAVGAPVSLWPLLSRQQLAAQLTRDTSPAGTYFDAFPILLMSSSGLAAMAAHRSTSQFDVRRFRPNIVIDTAQTGFPEEAWASKTGRLGGAVLKFEMACPRCVMTTHGFSDLPADQGVMQALVEANQGNLGIYASVVQPGVIKTGDTLKLGL